VLVILEIMSLFMSCQPGPQAFYFMPPTPMTGACHHAQLLVEVGSHGFFPLGLASNHDPLKYLELQA
jgi:hypothetical protein